MPSCNEMIEERDKLQCEVRQLMSNYTNVGNDLIKQQALLKAIASLRMEIGIIQLELFSRSC